MRIRVIVPVATDKWDALAASRSGLGLNPETVLDVVHLGYGPEAIQSEYTEARAAHFVLEEVQKGLDSGCDAMVIWCFSDPGLAAAREISSVPVLGIGHTAQLIALDLADRVGIITTLDQSVNRIRRKIAARGLAARIPCVRPLNIPVLEYDQKDRVLSRAGEIAARMIEHDGVEGIILGCGAMDGARAFIEKEFGVPVIEPGPVTVKQAETVVGFGLCHSKRSYMDPLPVTEHEPGSPGETS